LNKYSYASRKLATKFVDVSGHVVIGGSVVGEDAAAQPGERMQRLRQRRERARAALRIGGRARQRAEACACGFLGRKLALDQPLDALDRRRSITLR
jgi:hypothetical protein